MSCIKNVSRRGFLKGLLSGSALFLGLTLTPEVARAAPTADSLADRAFSSEGIVNLGMKFETLVP